MYRTIDLDSTSTADGVAAHRTAGRHPNQFQRALDPHAIAFITPVKDEVQYRICLRYLDALEVPSEYTVEKIAVLGGSSMAQVYQRAMEASSARYKIYLHVDGYIVHRGLLSELLGLFRTYPRLGMIGVEGATRLPVAVLYSVNNPLHCYGRIWNFRRPGGLSSLLGPANRRRLHFSRFRSFVGDYLPAAAVDGFFMATQYDIPWIHPMFGFDLYETVHAVEFVKAGLEVGLARQETVWCIHWGPLQESSPEQYRRRQSGLRHKATMFRQLYPAFIGVPVRSAYQQHRGAAERWTGNQRRERLGVVIAQSGGPEAVLRALRALLPQCEELQEVEHQVVVVDSTSSNSTAEVVRQEFPQVIVIASPANGGLAGAFNVGMRDLGFPGYVLVTRDDAEFSDGTLARMVSYLRGRSSTAGVVASLVDADGIAQPQPTAIVELVPRRRRRLQPIGFVGTTCALVRGEVFFDVGLFDERFSSWHGVLDWSLRAKRKGYKFAHLPQAGVIHHRRERSRQNGAGVFAECAMANLWLVYKHGGRRWTTALYWAQRLRAKWLAFRWRRDSEARRHLVEAMTRMEDLYRRLREENRRPQVLGPDES